MKKLCLLLLCFSLLSMNGFASESKFSDINGHWAKNVIEKWQDHGYINGYPDGSFKPDNPVTRAELAKILTLAFDLQESADITYDDIPDSEWYFPYLEKTVNYIPMYSLPTLYESNIPYSENVWKNKFLPDVNAIRMHVAEALVKIKIEKENIVVADLSIQEINQQNTEVFKDTAYHSLDAFPHSGIPQNTKRMNYYTWLAHKLNIMVGDDGYFYPYGYMTRAELLTAIDRIIE